MNIEQAFVKCNDSNVIKSIVERRLNGDLKELRLKYDVKAGDSFDVFLANDSKRKTAVSADNNGWITIIESKEVNDYSMLLEISKETESDVFAIMQYDSVGAWGFVFISKGEIIENYFSEEDEDYEEMIEEKLKERGIKTILLLFREVVQMKNSDWVIVKKDNG